VEGEAKGKQRETFNIELEAFLLSTRFFYSSAAFSQLLASTFLYDYFLFLFFLLAQKHTKAEERENAAINFNKRMIKIVVRVSRWKIAWSYGEVSCTSQ
jgi:hypothetical protein